MWFSVPKALISRTAALALAAAAALCMCLAPAGCAKETPAPPPAAQTPAPPDPTEAADEAHSAASSMREAQLYFISDEGYVVPVKKLIPWEQGIAAACLGYMTSTPANDREAALRGLRTVLPAGTEFTISIQNGEAKLDFTRLDAFSSAAEESAMLDAVVNTLLGFSTVDTVTVTKAGLGGRLENGTELPVRSQRRMLNIEQSELAASAGSAPGTLYFPNRSGALSVPVTRYFGAEPTLYSLVSALISGPEGRGLMGCFPNGTLLLGAAVENEVLTVNLSEDFTAVSQTEGLFELARDTLLLTVRERFNVRSAVIQVNGVTFGGE